MYILDTSAFIHVIKETAIGQEIQKEYGEEVARVTVFTVHETIVGAAAEKKHVFQHLFPSLEILVFNYEAALKSAEIEHTLRSQGSLVNKIDILIAAICILYGATLITTDRDFQRIPGLKKVILH